MTIKRFPPTSGSMPRTDIMERNGLCLITDRDNQQLLEDCLLPFARDASYTVSLRINDLSSPESLLHELQSAKEDMFPGSVIALCLGDKVRKWHLLKPAFEKFLKSVNGITVMVLVSYETDDSGSEFGIDVSHNIAGIPVTIIILPAEDMTGLISLMAEIYGKYDGSVQLDAKAVMAAIASKQKVSVIRLALALEGFEQAIRIMLQTNSFMREALRGAGWKFLRIVSSGVSSDANEKLSGVIKALMSEEGFGRNEGCWTFHAVDPCIDSRCVGLEMLLFQDSTTIDF